MENKFIAELSWGEAEYDPKIMLPSAIKEARTLWEQRNALAFKILQPNLKCFFIPENLATNIESIFTNTNFDSEKDVIASSLEITGLDFKGRKLPAISANANFTFFTTSEFSKKTIEHWEDKNSESISFAISFE